MISLIAVIDRNRALAKDGKLLVNLSEDLQRFKKITSGHPVIMGRKTYLAINKALPDRINIVLSKDPEFQAKDCEVFNNLDEALKFARDKDDEIFFIGGGEIYKQVLPLADKLYLTIIDAEYEADTWFPDYFEFNKIIKEEICEIDDLKYKFVELTK
ncbi:dihydrofolate reductase [bacterium]|jgi:dihydrofolate reductase|nr:dihydrofolate reductase [bacterium]MBT4649309.1 dihydrofolate reductase [bacterium]MBT7553611.1 dihydrofolate reductase [bacterium]